MRHRKKQVLAILGLAATAVFLGASLPAQAEQFGEVRPISDQHLTDEEARAIIDEFNRTGQVQGSAPPTDHYSFENDPPNELFELANEVREKHQSSNSYGPFEWVKENRSIKLWWHGELPGDVSSSFDAFAESVGIGIELAAMTHSGQSLREAAEQILDSEAAVAYKIQTVTGRLAHRGIGKW